MDNKKCLMINGSIERKDGKEVDINDFVDKFVNFIEQEGYFYGGGIKYDKELEEKKLSEYTKSEMLDLESRVESLIEDLNKEAKKEVLSKYEFDLNKDLIRLLSVSYVKNTTWYCYISITEETACKYLHKNEYSKLIIE